MVADVCGWRAGSPLGDAGVQLLMPALAKVPQLTSLDLEGMHKLGQGQRCDP